MTDLSEYEGLAAETGAYEDIELEILKEALLAWREAPGGPYAVVEIRDGRVLAGFALLCRETSTDFSYEVRAICVDPAYLGKGVAQELASKLEEEALGAESAAILRIETSTKKEAAFQAGLFQARSYSLIGHIPDFYGPGDDYFIYAKDLRRSSAGGSKEGAAAKEGAGGSKAEPARGPKEER
jgi:GNAT superfamily N-acetyltransferase